MGMVWKGLRAENSGVLVLQFGEIDLDARDLDALLGQEDAHAARVRGQIGIVELHAALLLDGRRLHKTRDIGGLRNA